MVKRGRRVGPSTPELVDVLVGRNIATRRRMMFPRMSQDKLGEAHGLTFQQVQKYESGANRVSASRLHAVSKILDVPIPLLLDGVQEVEQTPESLELEALLQSEEMHQLVENYYTLSKFLRTKFLELLRSLGTRDIRPEMFSQRRPLQSLEQSINHHQP